MRADRGDSALVARISPAGEITLIRRDEDVKPAADGRIIALRAPGDGDAQPPVDT